MSLIIGGIAVGGAIIAAIVKKKIYKVAIGAASTTLGTMDFFHDHPELLWWLYDKLPPTKPETIQWIIDRDPYAYDIKHYLENPWLEQWKTTQVVQFTDPLILDLNRDGKLKMENWVHFDYSSNGMHELAAWIDPGDAFLVLDKNFNGIIDNGSEMFGDAMILPDGTRVLTGWDALRWYDSNGDGKIDINDEIFADLKVLTGDGKLMSLADAGIKSITLPPLPSAGPFLSSFIYRASDGTTSSSGSGSSVQTVWYVNLGGLGTHRLPNDWSKLTRDEQNLYITDLSRRLDAARMANGGTYGTYSVFEWEDGTTSQIVDAYPYRIPMYSIAAEWLEVPEDIAALPDLVGFGNKHDLHQAMIRDESGSLRALVEQYMAEKNPQAREKIFLDILYNWAGVEDVARGSRGGLIDARQLAFLEAFFGEDFTGANGANPNNTAAPQLKTLFNDIARSMEMSLLAQTHLKPLFDNMGYDFTEPVLDENGKIVAQGMLNVSLDPAIEWLGELARSDDEAA